LYQLGAAFWYASTHNKKLVISQYDEGNRHDSTNYHETLFPSVPLGVLNNPYVLKEKKEGAFFSFPHRSGDVLLDGYFQSELFWSSRKDEFSQLFSFPSLPTDLADLAEESLFLHVRRGDYLNNPEIYGLNLTSYYKRALSYFPDVPVILFSDDCRYL